MKLHWIPVFALAFASPALAQADHAAHGPGSVEGVRNLYNTVKGYIAKSAEQMPEEHFAFKPTPDVRSFGQLLGHITDAHYLFCSAVLGETAPASDAEKITGKAQLREALQKSIAYCDRAYQIADAASAQAVDFFGQSQTKLVVLAFNMGHDFEHYGNIVTYMRLKGLVPPSSQGGM